MSSSVNNGANNGASHGTPKAQNVRGGDVRAVQPQAQVATPLQRRQEQQQKQQEDEEEMELQLNDLSLVSNNDMIEHGFEQQVLYKWLAEKGLAECTWRTHSRLHACMHYAHRMYSRRTLTYSIGTEKLEAANLTCLADLERVSSRDFRSHGLAFDDSIVLANAAAGIDTWRREQQQGQQQKGQEGSAGAAGGSAEGGDDSSARTKKGRGNQSLNQRIGRTKEGAAGTPSAGGAGGQTSFGDNKSPIGYPGLLRDRSISTLTHPLSQPHLSSLLLLLTQIHRRS
jgi:hypothetical protein